MFGFFIIGLPAYLIGGWTNKKAASGVVPVLAVVPHSLNHLPGALFAVFFLTATSLLFELPMAVLQATKSLETAIAFHRLVDFVRFLL